MYGLGTIINVAGILLGGLIGMLFGKFITPRFQEILMKGNGVCVVFLGISGALAEMLPEKSDGALMLIVSVAVGSLLGELLNIEKRVEDFGEWLKVKTHSNGEASFANGFLTTSVTVCVGAMTIIGSIQDGISGDYSILLAKTILDFILVIIMTASLGKGCIFSVIPVIVIQGGITALARLIEPYMTELALSNLSVVGSVLIFCVGCNLIRKDTFRTANMLPAILIAVAWAFF